MDYFRYIATDFVRRASHPSQRVLRYVPLFALSTFKGANAANTIPFKPVQTLTPEQADSVDQVFGELDYNNWVARGMSIRDGDNVYQCLANLTAALDLVGQLNQIEYNGAAGALSLLPTAGALLGSPTREMWVVYKLVPLAGVLSMFLSLGGSITPSNVGDYDPSQPFSYGGFMPTTNVKASKRPRRQNRLHRRTYSESQFEEVDEVVSGARQFADQVEERAEDDGGGGVALGVIVAMVSQLILIVSLLIPMWYAQRGAVVTWWCRTWGWMYFWYFLVTAVSIFDNLVAAPFSRSWSIRVSRRPAGVLIDDSIPPITDRSRYDNALDAIKAGPNTNQRIRIATDRGSGYSRSCFYVVISEHGISRWHAAAQVLAKASSVAVFAFGTALFASASLMSISVALSVLCLLLPCGVMGRVLAMWIVAQISRENRPVLHKLVKSEREAGEYFHAIAELDLQLEIRGHVILGGRCIRSRSPWFSPATYVGLLAKPFDAIGAAEKMTMRAMSASPSNAFQADAWTGQPMKEPISHVMHHHDERANLDPLLQYGMSHEVEMAHGSGQGSGQSSAR